MYARSANLDPLKRLPHLRGIGFGSLEVCAPTPDGFAHSFACAYYRVLWCGNIIRTLFQTKTNDSSGKSLTSSVFNTIRPRRQDRSFHLRHVRKMKRFTMWRAVRLSSFGVPGSKLPFFANSAAADSLLKRRLTC